MDDYKFPNSGADGSYNSGVKSTEAKIDRINDFMHYFVIITLLMLGALIIQVAALILDAFNHNNADYNEYLNRVKESNEIESQKSKILIEVLDNQKLILSKLKK